MKLVYKLTLFIFFSSSVFAGGQIGSGGNGCTLSNGEWKSMEELIYPAIFERTLNGFEKFDFEDIPIDSFKRIKLSDYVKYSSAFKKLNVLSFSYPRTYKALMSMTRLFESAYLVQRPIEGLFEGDKSFLFHSACVSFTPALMTLNSGLVVFFGDVWNQLSGQTSEVILIHEVFRLAQILHPSFKEMKNWELQMMTTLLFSGDPKSVVFQKYERLLRNSSVVELDLSKYQSFPYRYEMEKNLKKYFLF